MKVNHKYCFEKDEEPNQYLSEGLSLKPVFRNEDKSYILEDIVNVLA